MKKAVLILLLCLVCAALAACSASNADAGKSAPLKVDLDLSNLSGTVVYSQVYNIMYEPEEYFGKVIRVAGYYSAYEDKDRGVVYHACIIPDATACCAQGLEFVWAGEHAWPQDYPAERTDIVVTGVLESYKEDDITYLHLVNAELTWDKTKAQ